MNDERWRETVGRIKDTFSVIREDHAPLPDGSGETDVIEFESPLGRLKLERLSRREILDTKGLVAKRIGATSHVAHEFGDEVIQSVRAFRWQNDDWVEFDPAGALGG